METPVIAKINGIKIKMYYKDHNPPHVHAEYGAYDVLIVISDGSILEGDLPGKQFKIVLSYIMSNRDFLYKKWKEFSS